MPELVNDGLFVHLKIAPKKHWYNSFYASNRLLSVSNRIPVIDCKQNLTGT